MKHFFYWFATISLLVAIVYLQDNIQLAIYNVLVSILNMLFAIFWQLEEK
jgi:hypothetical protein